jgi:hypothetical protein
MISQRSALNVIEFKTKEGSRQRNQNKQKASRAVLDEQDIQRDEGISDPEWISEVYREVSGPNFLEAVNRGLKDQKAMIGERTLTPKKSVDVPTKPRLTSITESLNGNDILTRRLMAVTI